VATVKLSLVRETATPVRVTRFPGDVSEVIHESVGKDFDPDIEHVWIIILDTKNQVRIIDECSRGDVNVTVLTPRMVFRKAIAASGAAVIVVHNHPTGVPSPSPEDIASTKKLVEAGRLLDCQVLDHVIVTDDPGTFHSLRESGVCEFD
jgi:DNA repair protein RadC